MLNQFTRFLKKKVVFYFSNSIYLWTWSIPIPRSIPITSVTSRFCMTSAIAVTWLGSWSSAIVFRTFWGSWGFFPILFIFRMDFTIFFFVLFFFVFFKVKKIWNEKNLNRMLRYHEKIAVAQETEMNEKSINFPIFFSVLLFFLYFNI